MNPVLRTPRLTLRPMTPKDAPRLVALAGDPRVARMVSSIPQPYTVGEAGDFIARHALILEEGGRVWAICDSEGLQGAVGLHADPLRRAEAELGYWLGFEAWGRGYATEAGRAVLAEGFARGGSGEGFAELTSGYFTDNPASGKVLRKLGFRDRGEIRPVFCRARGEEVDCLRLDLAAGDAPPAPPFIDTARLILAPLQDEDAAELARIGDDPGIARQMANLPSPLTEAAALERIRASRFRGAPGFRLGLRRKADGALIGEWGVGPRNAAGAPDISWWLTRAARGQGYAREASAGLLDYLFAAFAAPAVRAEILRTNAASRRLPEALGFRASGEYPLGGEAVIIYELTRALWTSRRGEGAA
ncbi:GNAT family N-acetyltransferase [Neomegalonema sp.]|uniref:GNAT family N-acetyltransferase n=1 Tax=Neomegalonema sp. TaxID=2039713 RepID=UPI002626D172|nr:GNAT family N-acetyltransferase [Neomegalonema sp.]MDD2869037.1 GNAT family N-acetyltransferase [Neomegalonema sp.]